MQLAELVGCVKGRRGWTAAWHYTHARPPLSLRSGCTRPSERTDSQSCRIVRNVRTGNSCCQWLPLKIKQDLWTVTYWSLRNKTSLCCFNYIIGYILSFLGIRFTKAIFSIKIFDVRTKDTQVYSSLLIIFMFVVPVLQLYISWRLCGI